jgi:hypothetical protein
MPWRISGDASLAWYGLEAQAVVPHVPADADCERHHR